MIGNQPRPNGPTSLGERDERADAPGGAGETGGAGATVGAPTASTDPAGGAPAPTPWRPGPSPVATSAAPPTIAPPPAAVAPARPAAVGGADVAARNAEGRIHIADEVVEKVAALAATEVAGVANLGGDME